MLDYSAPILITQSAALPVGGGSPGTAQGVQNNTLSPQTERERLLTHIIFSPVIKTKNRTITITYTLTIAVARTPSE
jgi:hypothetical protein